VDPNLREYATDRQWEVLCAIAEHGSENKACEALGISRGTLYSAKQSVLSKAAQHGYAPDYDLTHKTAPGLKLKGTSTLYDESGNPRMQWVKTTADEEERERIFQSVVASLSEDIPRAKPLSYEKGSPDLMNMAVFSDYHLGMLAWHKEGGADWDLKIAEDTLYRCFSDLMARAPAASKCVIAQLGDFLHSDGLLPVTPTSQHVLDQDGRFSKIVEVAIRSLRRLVDMALQRHEEVHLILAEGNHDLASSVWLRQLFSALYENEPRITVDTTPQPYYAIQHGKTMLAFHHGHLRKVKNLQGVFAAQFPEIWGQTKYRYGHSGHLHHSHVLEDMGMTIVQHRTLAARDAYASRGGWFAERKAELATYHSKFGQVGSIFVTPEMT
jgi:hypothetical protein